MSNYPVSHEGTSDLGWSACLQRHYCAVAVNDPPTISLITAERSYKEKAPQVYVDPELVGSLPD